MTIRTVTLTAVAALSLGMAAHAQETRTITVPLTEPGAAAPAQSGPGTTMTVNSDGTTSVETTGAEPAAPATTENAATDTTPAALPNAVAQAVQQTPADSTEPVAGTPAATAEAPVSQGTPGEAPADEAPAAIQNPETTAEGTSAGDLSPATEPAAPADAGGAANVPTAEPVATDIEAPEAVAPATEAEAPATEAEAPAVEAEVPAVEAEAPAVEAEAPATEAEVPAVEAEAPTTEAEVPAVEAEAPTTEAETPAAEIPAEPEIPAAEIDETDSGTQDAAHVAVGEVAEIEAAADIAEPEAAPPPHEQHIEDVAFSFEGPFGKYDQFQLQRGLQVFTEVCASCHGLKQVPLRTLADPSGPGLPEDQVRAYSKEMTIFDAELDDDRERLPTDNFPTVTGEGMGPDLSLMAKARAGFHGPYGTGINQLFKGIGGPEYIHAILTSYTGETKDEAGATFYENNAFPGGWIAMPPPLSDDLVDFEDGAPNDLDNASKDVSAFLMWTAEPKMMARKQVGLVSVLFLIVLSALLYLTNKRLWWPLKHRRDVPGDGR